MIRKCLLALIILATLSPAWASSIFQIMSRKVMVTPVRGKIFVERDGKKSLMPVRRNCVLGEGDSLYVTEAGEAILHFPDGFQQTVDGEAEFKVTPIFPTSGFRWGSVFAFLLSFF